ncbi:2-oxoglutarate (2OG) and Fe(II)-dependent oxygenase superfamily protein [Melia azedarach]|uniref:2-oxoglutarate (2OG) and Fe(II)-dependent oxygenase superfamily protein n=1 Tax=Melia azedarach TaxID=155640 RepID=A0ACC1WYF8_MELAZ|nr:2-oxoglutarate (2OG) and Fe(II)-dependent oxygenase superfamily protein [Melia azedarach]
METKPPALGSSLPVPSVQELAKKPLITVPPRYIRPRQDPPFITDANSSTQVPVIDMIKLLSGEVMESELEKFHHACKDWGFFQLINHGVSSLLVEKVKKQIQDFFNLPVEEKKKYSMQPGDIEGFGQAFVVSEEQKLDWADIFYMVTLPIHLRKPHLFPKLPLPLRDTLEAYSAEMRNLALKILNQMAKALRMDPSDMKELFEEGMLGMRMNYYPPCPQPELVIGLNPHSDAGGLTILLQLNEIEGLQIKKDGKWIPVKPLPDSFIINIGDMLEIVTNGIYRSIEHRVTVNTSGERLSMATFCSLKLEGEVSPAPSLITPETPALFRRIGVADFLRGYLSRELSGKSYVDEMRIQNEDNKS